MSSEPNYVVVRPSPDLPPGFLPEHLDGKCGYASAMVNTTIRPPAGRLEINTVFPYPARYGQPGA